MSACHAEHVENSKVMTMTLGKHFDFRSVQMVRSLCSERLEVEAEVVVDMTATRYIDSSGVALLLCMYQWIRTPRLTVRVINCCPAIRHILSSCRHRNKLLIQ